MIYISFMELMPEASEGLATVMLLERTAAAAMLAAFFEA